MLVIACAVALLAGLALGRALRKPWLVGCLPLVVLIAIVAGAPTLLALAGKRTIGFVVDKHETLAVRRFTGQSDSRFAFVVHFKPASTDSIAVTLGTSRLQYDMLRIGSAVDVRYLPSRPTVAMIADRSALQMLLDLSESPDVGPGIALLLAMLIAVWLSTRRLVDRAEHVARALVVATCAIVAAAACWLWLQNPDSVPTSATNNTGLARVIGVQRIRHGPFALGDSDGGVLHFAQAFDVIELEFFAQRARQVVRAVDAVDAGSIPELGPGAIVRTEYDMRAPRTLRITDGTRTFRERNRRDIVLQCALAVAALAAAVALAVSLVRRTQRATG